MRYDISMPILKVHIPLIITLSLSLVVLSGCSTPAFAQTVTPTTLQTRQAAKEAAMEERKEAIQEKVAAKRQAAEEKAAAKREALKTKIQTLKDEKKKEVVERLNTKLTTVNANRTTNMSEILAKLNEILGKVTTKAADAKTQGKDTSVVDAAVSAAKDALTKAETAITTQAGKDYTLTITTETALKNTVGQTTSQMQVDLKATHATVVETKRAVSLAATELRKLLGTPTTQPIGTVTTTP